MSKTVNRNSVVIGLILIFIGFILLFHKLGMSYFNPREIWPQALILIGGLLFIKGILNKDRKGIFPGTYIIIIGLFFYMIGHGFLPFYHIIEIWPVFIIAAGVSFFILFLFKLREVGLLITAFILIFFGLILTTDSLGYISWYQLKNIWRLFLPLCLIFTGIIFVLKSLVKKH